MFILFKSSDQVVPAPFPESIIARLAKCRVVAGFAPATVAEAVPIARALLSGGLCSYMFVVTSLPATEVTLPRCGHYI